MPSVKKTFFAIVAIVFSFAASAQYVQPGRYDDYSFTKKMNVGSGTVRVTAPSAYFEVGPTLGGNAGFLVPRLSTAERNAIVSPADGLMIYNVTSKKFNYFDGSSSSWKEIGSGTGSGITQLGSSPWGLSILDDSTYVVDSMKVLTKYQGEKTRDSLAALINLRMLKSDSLSVGNPTGYVTGNILKDSAGKKADTSQLVKINTSYRPDSSIVYYDSTTGTYKHIPKSSLGGVTSSSSGAFSVLKWRTGDENAPAANDTLIINSGFKGKYGEMYRGKNYGYFLEHVVSDTGFVRVNDSTFKVSPAFAENEWYYIRLTDSSALTQLTLEAPSTPPSTTIAYIGATDGGNNGGSGTTRTFSVTVSSGSDRILLVGIVGDVVAGADDITGVTYAGSAMTFINKTSDGNRRQYLYYILNPTTGANNVVVTAASSHWLMAGAIEYTGVQGIDVNVAENATGVSTKTTTVTTTTNNNWNVIFSGTQGYTQTAGSGATKRTPTAANGYWTWFDSGAAITPAGSYSMTTSLSTGANIGHCLVSLKPY